MRYGTKRQHPRRTVIYLQFSEPIVLLTRWGPGRPALRGNAPASFLGFISAAVRL